MSDSGDRYRGYLSRRRFLRATGLAGVTGLAGCGGESDGATDTPTESATATETDAPTETTTSTPTAETQAGAGAYDPGPPRFVQVGERLMDPIFTDAGHGFDRDNLAPSVPDPQRDPENYPADAFEWSLAEKPEGSEAELVYAPTPYDDAAEQYDAGTHNTAEFAADVPGRYVVELDAPDGTYEQTIHAFEARPTGAGGPPSVELSGTFDADAEEFVVESNPALAADSRAASSDLEVVFLPHDSAKLSPEDIEVDDQHRAHVPKETLDGPTEIYAAAFDGEVHSYTDEVVLDPEEESVSLPNRPPEWLDDAVIYEIFTRSFAGKPGATDFQYLAEKASYLGELGVDVVWLTPIVPAWSAQIEAETDHHAPGGPHGYSAGDYFAVADDLGTMADFEAFVDACHEHDIRVCFDFVINHCGWTNPKFQDTIAETGPDPENFWRFPEITEWNEDSKYFDWFDRMAGSTALDAAPAYTSFFGVRLQPNLNYGNVALREHILAAADFWSEKVDAFRCDIAWGVPHSFWKEIRDLVKAKDTEFMLLDETIPNDPSFAESEFDVHFDTKDFMATVKSVAVGDAKPDALVGAVQHRTAEGFPSYTRLVNSLENHDESRLYHEVKASGGREDPAKTQRAAAAASFTLPGVPFIYYGQERLISEYGHRRTSPFADIPELADDIESDPYKRAFMNWAENGDDVPEDHLQFYKDLVAFYHDSDVLGPEADLRRAWYRTDATDDVLAFGLDAGDETRVVVVNFGADAAEVDLRAAVSTTDAFSGSDVGVDSDEETVTVSVDTFAVLETPDLFGLGERIVGLGEETGDDHGPGSYTYPTGVADGAFDIAGFTTYETSDAYQFAVDVAGPVENARDYPHGFSAQHLQFYLSNGKGLWGSKEARAGVNATFPDYYQFRVVADGENGARVEAATGEQVATGDVAVLPGGTILVSFPKTAINGALSSQKVAPLLLGYDPGAEGNVMQVTETASESAFGGGSANAPNVVDLVTPAEISQSKALAYSADSTATLPFTPLKTSFATTAAWSDPTGDDHGPGSYTYPTAGDFYENAFDLTEARVEESREMVRFVFEMAEPVQNPWGLGNGFSHQFYQVYVRDPDAGDDQPSSTAGRFGSHLAFDKPYHYRVVANGEQTGRVEVPDPEQKFGEVATTDTTVGLLDEKTVHVDVPKRAIGGGISDKAVSILVMPYDGYGEGGLRAIAESKGKWAFGGGGKNAPAVIDMVVPEGTTQSKALSFSADSTATLPYLDVQE